jgi:hypothetical protein
MKSFFALLLAGGLLAGLIYLCSLFPAPVSTSSVSQHISLDNHTQVVINASPDYASIALIILAVAVLLFVVSRYLIPAIKDWRRP